jgi:hypothetical protein
MFVGEIARPAWLSVMGVESVLSYQDLSAAPGLIAAERFAFPISPDVPASYADRIPNLSVDPQTGQPQTVLTLWRNERFRGEAFVAPMPRLVRPEDPPEAAQAASAELAADSAAAPEGVLVADPGFTAGGVLPVATIDERFGVTTLRAGPNSFIYQTDFPQPALLCLAQSAYPGWAVRVDGELCPLSRLCGTFLAVAIPAGLHEVSFSYHPPGLEAGLWISVATLVVLIYGCGRGLLVRRRQGRVSK